MGLMEPHLQSFFMKQKCTAATLGFLLFFTLISHLFVATLQEVCSLRS
jgi:hypothetical protein